MADINTIALSLYKKHMRKIDYKLGDSVNGTVFICNSNPKIQPTGRKRRAAIFECKYCGEHYEQRISDIMSGKTVSCGCKKQLGQIRHGLKGSKYYNLWRNIKGRCLNPNNSQFKDYGGRGISIYEAWINDCVPFIEYIMKLDGYNLLGPGANDLSIDRINVNGHYEPGNLRFATRSQQAKNKRK